MRLPLPRSAATVEEGGREEEEKGGREKGRGKEEEGEEGERGKGGMSRERITSCGGILILSHTYRL